ncbi:hypothetical protein NDU88_002463 [Pleurodeles waltl]|uniref:Uncharacterized protein n=1 Tax=Pleurodeles waltl TaxID=8319 RepID=A0AAV7WLB0_PLEWA|nr:hypothetical protein NDU88_002463 [Pleurodeles waltl]
MFLITFLGREYEVLPQHCIVSETVISRELDSLTTSNIESGAERRSADSGGHESKDIGNPDCRIPEHIPARSREEETIAEAGNPDIQVPDSVKREDRLRTRELDSPTTSNIESGADCRSADSCGHESKDIGNPDGRIPEHIPARSREEEPIAEAGNPDIRVRDSVKREDGLRARRTFKTRDAEEGRRQRGERREVVHGQTPAEEQKSTGQDDTAPGQDGPKELERRHVPGGMWLSQLRSCLKDRLRYIVGREGVSRDE